MKNTKTKNPQPVATVPGAVTETVAVQSAGPVEASKPSNPRSVKNPIDAQEAVSEAKAFPDPLSPEQHQRRAELEKIIDEGLPVWRKLCSALDEIKTDELFRPFETFHKYCANRFHLAKSTCYAYAKAGHALRLIQSSGEDYLPENEAQLRPVLDLNDDQALMVWREAVKSVGSGVLSEGIVRKAREKLIQRPVREFKLKDEGVKIQLSIRHLWDKCPAQERPTLINELLAFVSALREELIAGSKQATKSPEMRAEQHQDVALVAR